MMMNSINMLTRFQKLDQQTRPLTQQDLWESVLVFTSRIARLTTAVNRFEAAQDAPRIALNKNVLLLAGPIDSAGSNPTTPMEGPQCSKIWEPIIKKDNKEKDSLLTSTLPCLYLSDDYHNQRTSSRYDKELVSLGTIVFRF